MLAWAMSSPASLTSLCAACIESESFDLKSTLLYRLQLLLADKALELIAKQAACSYRTSKHAHLQSNTAHKSTLIEGPKACCGGLTHTKSDALCCV